MATTGCAKWENETEEWETLKEQKQSSNKKMNIGEFLATNQHDFSMRESCL